MFSSLFEITFNGQGGFTYDQVYSMPIWLRTFNYHKLVEHKEKEKAQYDKASKGKGKQLSGPGGSKRNIK